MKLKWLTYSIIGLLLFGFGLSLLGEAILLKNNNEPFFWFGTLALVVINSGLCFFGNAIIFKIKLDRGESD
ncbi:MAG: hypothetical protein CMF85_00735 [Candidatus Marinimicrobia bacterium]|nr:hypothetical protein [Candidatus Neomarinimicrobiota bacterium]MEC7854816.1 hypothetical protein [Candidatus Neomarinimicrobiota bacterium]MEC7980510.1 hypothetical protein [Candidatus Neomarinimicrobiota bacterium]|tara:strand:- start:608 stop:820 length:213 start_codon:yes stop_codon:yes gene_type:complete